MMKKIDIDCCNLYKKRTGVGRYLSNLLNVWMVNSVKNINLYYKNELSGDFFNNYEGYKNIIVPHGIIKKNQYWTNIKLYSKLLNSDSEIYFTPNYTIPALPIHQKKVVTIFDISYISNPEWFPMDQRLALNLLTGHTIRNSSLILTGSNATKNEILKYYNLDEKKIKVTALGVDYNLRDALNISKNQAREILSKKYKINEKVILFVGLLMNRRNIDVTIRALNKINRKNNNSVSFVIIGKDHTFPKINFERIIESENQIKNIVKLTYISDDELKLFYRLSDCFICASSCEGFNITPLEAMYLGVPVVTSRMSSLPEVVGSAACFMENPQNIDSQVDSISKVLFDTEYALELISKGNERAKLFSWEKCANETLFHINNL
jgi:glycosyltransferase involved in cell wall biosynthesis